MPIPVEPTVVPTRPLAAVNLSFDPADGQLVPVLGTWWHTATHSPPPPRRRPRLPRPRLPQAAETLWSGVSGTTAVIFTLLITLGIGVTAGVTAALPI